MGKLNLKALETIYIKEGTKIKPGVKVSDGFVVGKLLSHGVQGEVSTLIDEQGNDTDWLVKVMFLRNAFDDMEREWKIGRTLNLLNNKTFMFTGPAIRGEKSGTFLGMFIHKILGTTCDTIVMDPKFTDVRWLRKCLFTSLMALDEAQKLLGFHHYDFRLGNIMVTGKTKEDWTDADKAEFKIIDFGLGAFDESYALIPNDSEAVTTLVKQLCQRQGNRDDDSNSTDSKSQLSSITSTLGGLLSAIPSAPSKIYTTLRDKVGDSDSGSTQSAASRVRMSLKLKGGTTKDMAECDTIHEGVQLATPTAAEAAAHAADPAVDTAQDQPANTVTIGNKQLVPDDSSGVALAVETTSEVMDPAENAAALQGAAAAAPDSNNSPPGESDAGMEAPVLQADPVNPVGEVTSQSWSAMPFAKGDPVPQWITTGIFKGYRQFWQHKGDVLYLCFSLVANLDYNVWPKEEEHDVRRLMNFIHHVTGIRLKVKFSDNPAALKTAKRRKWFHIFRTIHVRGRVLFRPFNSGISAAEAMCAPFFAVCPENPYNGLSGRTHLERVAKTG